MSWTTRLTHTPSILFAEGLEARRLFAGQVFPGEGPGDEYRPNFLVTADFNGDGRADLAISDDINTVSVSLNDGQGGFLSATHYTTADQPSKLTTGDFTGDGKLDIVIACADGHAITVLPGNGNGTFGAAINTSIGNTQYYPTDIVAGDFDKDGKLDIVWSSSFSSAGLNVMRGTGTGTFGAPAASGGFGSITDLAVGEFTGDSNLDVVTASGTQLLLYPGTGLTTGTGLFPTSQSVATSSGSMQVVAGDFNNDGKLDLVYGANVPNGTPNAPGQLVSLRNSGTGNFTSISTITIGGFPIDMTTADFNNDGKLDVAAITYDIALRTYLGNGANALAVVANTVPLGGGALSLVSADFNGDGRADLASSHGGSDGVIVHMGRNDGTFIENNTVATGTSPGALVTGDFNNDHKADVAVINTGNKSVSIKLGNGAGGFDEVNEPFSLVTTQLAAADFNGDGNLDLAVTFSTTSNITVLYGSGNGQFGSSATLANNSTPGPMVVADFNNDGRPDLAATRNGSSSVGVFLAQPNGTFAGAINVTSGDTAVAIAAGDLDKDGKIDLVVANATAQTLSIIRGNGNGTFAAPTTLSPGTTVGSVAIADFNNDTLPDLAVTNTDQFGRLSIYLASSAGVYGAPTQLFPGHLLGPMITGDFDGDGNADLAIADRNTQKSAVSLLYGNGAGTFRNTIAPTDAANSVGLVSADFNGDGKPDLITSNTGSNTISLIQNVRANVGSVSGVNGTLELNSVSGASNAVVTKANGMLFITSPAGVDRRLLTNITTLSTFQSGSVQVNSDLGADGQLLNFSNGLGSSITFNTSQHLASLGLASGNVGMSSGRKLLRATSLSVTRPARLNLNDSDMIVDYTGTSPIVNIQSLLTSGRQTTGTWNGVGIYSSAAAASANHATTLGFMEATDYKSIYGAAATLDGEAIDSTAVLVKYTLYGDADLNTTVDFNDFLRLQNGFGGTNVSFAQGDFDYNGTTDFNDFLMLQNNFGQTLPSAKAATPAAPPTPPTVKTASIAGTVFHDNNRNGKFDAGDGIGRAAVVYLDLDNDGVKDANEPSAVADGRGKFGFKNLAAGKYRVRQVLAAGAVESTPARYLTLASGQAAGGVLLGSRVK